ncbi:uncharacterized protein A4U43_C05F12650 [Asparagus officinalis]|uniref:glycerophosphodiester phosphodiesterase n=1 Tax=Asparagus officinalis TaxID=4686 RepID=A0A5P1ERE1_ASPOF|nr:glycerophosphodiester phosphodiesterase GDPDL4-like [Asparagus officinalis]ONK68516.1 uncharacterized protein A4U43_C05F12650 [Asparagus officinalis]
MWEVFFSLLLLLQCQGGKVTAQRPRPSPWQTLKGDAPVVVAKGGFSGLFPDSSLTAYTFALVASSPDTILWCDVQLTKDGIGVCLPNVKLDNCTDISGIYPQRNKVYLVNGVSTPGWFSVDFNSTELAPVSLIQGIYSRTDKFDQSLFPILGVEDVVTQLTPPAPILWLNIQHDIFYSQHNLSMRNFVLSVSKRVVVSYLSSPEVAFLSGISPRFKKSNTKLVFRFLDEDVIEPSTNQTYGSLLKNLTFIETFASGILVPKHYIWPVTSDNYLQPYTSIVMDAHKAGLEIFAGDFANDAVLSYNYSYSPLAEQLSFIDNGAFSVDGVVTDFPITPSEAIGCFSHINKSTTDHGKPIIVSHYGASGDYPDCTNLAYEKAVEDGADIIDCPVQVTSDRVPICMSSINLMDDTTVLNSPFSSPSSQILDIQSSPGIFTFNLTWDEIKQNLKPQISSPESSYMLVRNPRYKNAGSFMTLSDFLKFAKDKALSGVLISIEHAAFMAEKLGFDVTNTVITALKDNGFNNQTTLGVTIQSTNSSVLVKFKQQTKYNLMYKVDESIRDAVSSSIVDIKKFADSVAVDKESIYPTSMKFITGQTQLVSTLQKGGLAVYVYILRNEFVSQAWDFFSDPIVEINSFVEEAGVDGVITDFPGTARAYKSNSCTKLGDDAPGYMQPVQVGGLLQLLAKKAQPPAEAPFPILNPSDVVEPPLPPAINSSTPTSPGGGGNASAPPTPPSKASICTISSAFSTTLLALFGFLLFF